MWAQALWGEAQSEVRMEAETRVTRTLRRPAARLSFQGAAATVSQSCELPGAVPQPQFFSFKVPLNVCKNVEQPGLLHVIDRSVK